MLLRARILGLTATAALALGAIAAGTASCYSAGGGQAPPLSSFYFPVALAVSEHGNVLYAANSDFDLQWNGGTLQAYDLHAIRRDVVRTIANPNDPNVPYLTSPTSTNADFDCAHNAPTGRPDDPSRTQPAGWTCAPPVDPSRYFRDAVIIGAFATDLRRVAQRDSSGTAVKNRLFVPVRGDASLTWADIDVDLDAPPPDDLAAARSYPGLSLQCGRTGEGRCDDAHHAGNTGREPGNTRGVTMPGEPFGVAVSDDATSLVITHQSDTKASLFSTGLAAPSDDPNAQSPSGVTNPSIQFVLDGLPAGGVGIASIPHDPDAYQQCVGSAAPCAAAPRPAFLEASRSSTQISMLRYYDDQAPGLGGGAGATSSLLRPFLINEANFRLGSNAGGTDSRGIVIDPSPRIRCKAAVAPANPTASPPRTAGDVQADLIACARTPSRVFITNRTPSSLVVGTVGESGSSTSTAYNADVLNVSSNLPLPSGPSRLYLAPIVDKNGNYALRVFVVCYDASQILVYDPDAGALEGILRVGRGPFALAFDPFSVEDAALGRHVAADPRQAPDPGVLRYRFAYLASFTDSFLQVLDLDASRTDKSSFETIVFRLGAPTAPKGS
jgi:hypothetical protein